MALPYAYAPLPSAEKAMVAPPLYVEDALSDEAAVAEAALMTKRHRRNKMRLLGVMTLLFFVSWTCMQHASMIMRLAGMLHDQQQLGSSCLVDITPVDTSDLYTSNRLKVLTRFRSAAQYTPGEIVFMLGNKQEERTNSDTDILFRQDSTFLYFTGYNVPEASLAVDIDSGEALLFVPRKSRSELIFDGGLDDFEQIKRDTGVDEVFYDDEAVREIQARYSLARINTMDEEALVDDFPLLSQYTIDDTRLWSYSFTARQEKSETELNLLRVSALITSQAHEAIMRSTLPGTTEYEIEARFLFECNTCGLRFQSYIPIVGAGKNGAVLHYVRNNAPVLDGDLVLVDAAGEYYGYTSDVTRTYPANGVFSQAQRAVYQTVLDAQQAAIAVSGPGVSWSTLTSTANRKLIEGLVNAEILIGDVDTLLSAGVLGTFYPHGLGHPVGLDVHDPTPSPWVLTPGQVFTVEPGIYFIDMLLEEARNSASISRYFNWPLLDSLYVDFGGVRIEDVVAIHSGGYDVLSTVPRTIVEIEALMAQGPLPRPRE